jgi:hypothetical protein
LAAADRIPGGRVRPSSFLATLFDASFADFITMRLVKGIYLGGLLALAFGVLVLLLGALGTGKPPLIVFALALAPAGFLLGATMLRICLEVAIVLFRIADHVAETADQAAAIAINTARAPRA